MSGVPIKSHKRANCRSLRTDSRIGRPRWRKWNKARYWGDRCSFCATDCRTSQNQRALLIGDADELRGDLFLKRRALLARIISCGRFDFDHIGAVIAQDLSCERTPRNTRKIDELQTFQRAGIGSAHCAATLCATPSSSARARSSRAAMSASVCPSASVWASGSRARSLCAITAFASALRSPE